MNNLLEVKNLSVILDNEKIIDNLSFQVGEGKILTILGQNGVGKSVLIQALLGLLPHTGEITWKQNPKIGYLPQGLNQLKLRDLPLTVQDFFRLKDPFLSLERINKFLQLVGLNENILHKKAGNLSAGQFQRMLIAWVLISDPQVIFLDEPTTGIDIGGGETINSLMHNIQKQKKLSIFLVTHDLNIVFKYSDQVLCLNRKSHNCFGSPKEILTPQILEKTFGTEIKFYEHN
jgi:zinc transport system ATP-binding protein